MKGQLVNKNGRWHIRVTVDGRQRQRLLLDDQQQPVTDRRQAQSLRREAVALLLGEEAGPSEVTLGQLWEAALAAPRSKLTEGVRNRRKVDRLVAWAATQGHDPESPASVVTMAVADAFVAWNDGVNAPMPNSHNELVGTLSLVWRTLGLTPNVWDGLRRSVIVSGKLPFSRDQVGQIFAHVDGLLELSGQRVPGMVANVREWRVLMRILRFAGLRFKDACQLRWSSVDLDAGLITVTPAKTKRFGKLARIPISASLRAQLEVACGWRDSSGYVLPEIAVRRDPVATANKLIEDAGIRRQASVDGRNVCRYGTHSFRHAWINETLNAGMSMKEASLITGDNIASLESYLHIDTQGVLDAIDRGLEATTKEGV